MNFRSPKAERPAPVAPAVSFGIRLGPGPKFALKKRKRHNANRASVFEDGQKWRRKHSASRARGGIICNLPYSLGSLK